MPREILNPEIRNKDGTYKKPKKGDVVWITDRKEIFEGICEEPNGLGSPCVQIEVTYKGTGPGGSDYKTTKVYCYPNYHLTRLAAEEYLLRWYRNELIKVDNRRKGLAALMDAQAEKVALARIEAGLDPNNEVTVTADVEIKIK